MKITDRMNAIEGVDESFWDSNRARLVIYYLCSFPSDVIKVRVAKALSDACLQDSVREITLFSV